LHKKYYNDFYHFFLNIFLISFWGIEKGFSFNTPIWSVSIEILAYIIFFISINFLKKYKIYFTTLIIFFFFLFIKLKYL
jgi:peptidoglycan/LPS O-acetylase OafA/YrhL